MPIADDFATKARVNPRFVLATTPGISDICGMSGSIAFQPAYQTSVEGLGLLPKAQSAQQGTTPPRKYLLSYGRPQSVVGGPHSKDPS